MISTSEWLPQSPQASVCSILARSSIWTRNTSAAHCSEPTANGEPQPVRLSDQKQGPASCRFNFSMSVPPPMFKFSPRSNWTIGESFNVETGRCTSSRCWAPRHSELLRHWLPSILRAQWSRRDQVATITWQQLLKKMRTYGC